MQKVLIRFGLYALAFGLVMAGLILLAVLAPGGLRLDQNVTDLNVTTSEFSPVELLQNGLLIFCIGALLWVANADRLRRPMTLTLAALLLAFLVRELDFFLDFYVIDNLWQVLCALIVSIAGVYAVRHRDRFVQGWRRSWPSAGLAMILMGFIVLIPFAQLLGHEALWEAVLGNSYIRVVKVATEEFVELGAYLMITAGIIEFLYAWSRLPRKKSGARSR